MPETAIFDHYEVLTRDDGSLFELGRGAMGITYKAFDTSLRIPVALKVINSTYLNSEVARQRFVREARSAAKLRHRNVATVFHLGTEGDTWFYAMEFIDGETLDSLIKRQGPLTPALALGITGQVARALNAAVPHDLVHRDIKPANLMLVKEDDELVAKVIDFGLAKSSVAEQGEDAATLSMGGFVGTPHFASPEQLEEREIDVRSDIYSLGVTLWYMLAGQAPFAGSMAQVMSQHLSKPPPYEKLDKIPPSVADILHKMLAKDPTERYQSPAELRKAVEDAIENIGDAPAAAAATDAGENFATLLDDSASRSGLGSFETNTIIAGRYRVAESLGETNTGRLFHAYDTQQKREVRLIVLPPAALGDTTALTALEREVEKLSKVKHGNLLGVIDFETVDRGSFLVLEWTNGFSLLDLLKARRELNADEALKLLAQAAEGVDYALSLGLTGLEFGLHQVYLHFPQAIEKEALLHEALSAWPSFEVKLYPLGATRDIATSQTWAGAQTMVGGSTTSSHMEGADARPRYVQALAAIIYEVLGGTLSPLVLRGAGGPTMRYTPLSTLSEEGNEVLKQALDPARSFASAKEFSRALGQLDGLQVSRREIKVAAPPPRHATHGPATPARTAVSETPAFVPTQTRKPPLALIGGIAALLVAGGVAAFLFFKKPEDIGTGPGDPKTNGNTSGEITEVSTNGQNTNLTTKTATPVPATPPPATPPPPPTKQEMVKSAVDHAQELEDKGDWDKALNAWLKLAKEYPEFPVGKTHIETMLEPLRKRPNPLSPSEFREMRAEITEAAQLNVLAAMMLLADNIREAEPEAAFNWYSMAADRKHAPAMTQIGLMYSNTTLPGTPDLVKAVEFLKAAADLGDAPAKAALGDCYLKGKGVPKDEKRGLEMYREAASGGDLRAMNRLGDVLRTIGAEAVKNGQSGETYFAEAFQVFTTASSRGNFDALGNLAVLYLNGEGVPEPDPKKAAALFDQGAKGDNPFCMWGLARCYENGIGVPKNLLTAQRWYKKAAEAGDRRAVEWCKKSGVTFTPRN